jgi:pyruvate,water dikinase
MQDTPWIRRFEDVGRESVGLVGGKNASLGEMIKALRQKDIRVPPGFATTAEAYRHLLDQSGLRGTIEDALGDHDDGKAKLAETGRRIREAILETPVPDDLADAIARAYAALAEAEGIADLDVAVRSSATAEDLPEASFAGQQESFLGVRGKDAVLQAWRRCVASLFTDRAIAYREAQGFDHLQVALSVGVQRMVRSDEADGGAGVIFTLDTDTGFPDVVLITAGWGLGETVVKGTIAPDQITVFEPLLDDPDKVPILERIVGTKAEKIVYAEDGTETVETSEAKRRRLVLDDDEALQLARWAVEIERHYGCPMDIEWAKDGRDDSLWIVQARPETVQSRRESASLRTYSVKAKGEALVNGLAIGDAAAVGKVCRIADPKEGDRLPDDGVLVTGATDPDWVPIMKRAAAIVTDHGGRTSHAAIVSRELGLPAIVGAGDATERLEDGRMVTVSCAEGDRGVVYDGEGEIEVKDIDLEQLPETRTEVMLNLANPAAAMRWWRLPADGVGLARMEFVVSNWCRVHPMALLRPDRVEPDAAERIAELTKGYDDPVDYFVDRLATGIARIAAPFHPHPVILRTSDFKTNEYANLVGGKAFEPEEENPMLGFRGASRYYSDRYRPGFELECRAIRRVRETIGLTNVVVMIPFCRTLGEADRVLEVMREAGLVRGENGLEVYVMCEIPSNVISADAFAERFDGFSIGSNDLTQLTLGVDRDSDLLAHLFDETDPAVTTMIEQVIARAHEKGRKVGLCGQRPSDDPDFARFLVEAGIDSVSVTPDSFLKVKQAIAAAEQRG